MEQKEINIDKLVAGDERAFIAFIEYHSSALYHYAFNILHQKECAEEVVSDVFLEVWKHRKKLGKIENKKGGYIVFYITNQYHFFVKIALNIPICLLMRLKTLLLS